MSVCVSVLGEPVSKASKAVVHRERQIMFTIISVICILTAVVVTAVVCIYRRYGRFMLLIPKVGSGYSDSKARKRVVVMHSNVLYYPGDGGKDSDSMMPFLPVVKIEPGVPRLTPQSSVVPEYEIPLDKDWEFPRDK